MNLLQNALDALDSGDTIGRRLEIVTRPAERQAVVAVSDSGPGIPPSVGERAFERFYTTKAEGMGLGLAIGRSIAEAHGGKLWFTSQLGEGTTFYLSLPVVESAEAS